MTVVHRHALVPYTPEQMIALVEQVSAYPEFLPWCIEGSVLAEEGNERLARLTFAAGVLRKSFTTRNRLDPGKKIEISLVEGPFQSLTGAWQFRPLGMREGTKVVLDLEFNFANAVLAAMVGPVFNQIANTLVHSFCERAKVVYGSCQTNKP